MQHPGYNDDFFSFDNTDHLHCCMDDLYLDIYGEKTLIKYLNIVIHFILSFNNVLVYVFYSQPPLLAKVNRGHHCIHAN